MAPSRLGAFRPSFGRSVAFADVEALVSVTRPLSNRTPKRLAENFTEILDEAGHPEAINDSYTTCPSRRITEVVPAYRKRVYGPIVTKRIGMDMLRDHCDHFACWVAQPEKLDTEGD